MGIRSMIIVISTLITMAVGVASANDTCWAPLGEGVNNNAHRPTLYNGEVVVIGVFTSAGGAPASRIASWNGSEWSAFGSGLDGQVNTACVYNGELYAGGFFSNRIRKWNGTAWEPVGSGAIGPTYGGAVNTLVEYKGDLVACGFFTSMDGVTVNKVAKFDGSTWSPLGSGIIGVTALTMIVFDDKLYVGGDFSTAGGIPVKNVAVWDGTSWSAVGAGFEGGECDGFGIYNGQLLATGYYRTSGGVTLNGISRLNESASIWEPLGSGFNGNTGPVLVYGDELYVGGNYTSAGGNPANYLAIWNGSEWRPAGLGTDGGVGGLIDYNGDLIVTGSFHHAGGEPANNIAMWMCPSFKMKQVYLDIKPGSCPNPLNVKPHVTYDWVDMNSHADNLGGSASKLGPYRRQSNGVLPVAILGTADFDVTEIDPETIMLEGVPLLRWSYEDVSTPMPDGVDECECHTMGPDGFIDLNLKFGKTEVTAALGAVADGDIIPLTITGSLYDETPITGSDCVLIVHGEDPSDEEPIASSAGPSLGDNFPNPFNPVTQIKFSLPQADYVNLSVFNTLGQRVKTLVDRMLYAGEHTATWDASDMASGVYLYRLQTGDFVETKKMMLIK